MKLSLLIALVVLSGCATRSWQRDGSTQAAFNMESAQCRVQQASAPPTVGAGAPFASMAVWSYCMEGKGWELKR